jgi:hypothetical protein
MEDFRRITGNTPSILDVFVAEQLAYTYFPKQVAAIIVQIFKRSKKKESGLDYYVQPVSTMMKQKRQEATWIMTEEEKQVYYMVSRSLLMDFNHDDLVRMKKLCAYPANVVKEAIKVSHGEKVHSIPYYLAVAERIQAEADHKRRQKDAIREQVYVAKEETVHKHTILDLAHLSHSWQQAIQNVELENKVKRLYEGD